MAHHGAPQAAVQGLGDDDEKRVADLFTAHHDRDPNEVDPAETHDPARLAGYPIKFQTRAAAFSHSALLLALALAAFAAGQAKYAVYLWAFLSYNPLSMLSSHRANRAGAGVVGEDGDEEVDGEGHAGLGHDLPPDPGRSFASRAWKALRELRQGQLARAFRALNGSEPADLQSPGCLAKLAALLRFVGVPLAIPLANPNAVPAIPEADVVNAVKAKPRLTSPGFGGWSFAMIQDMLTAAAAAAASPALKAFPANLTRLVYLIGIGALTQAAVWPLLASVRGIVLVKDLLGGIRPLGVACVFTSLAACVYRATDAVKEAMRHEVHESDLSHGVKGGSEAVSHTIRALLASNPTWVVIQLDMKNAFNSISRAEVLAVGVRVPILGPLINMLYGATTCVFYRLGVCKKTDVGVSQGDPLGNFLFSAVFSYALRFIHAGLIPVGCLLLRFADDTYLLGPPETVFALVEQVRLAALTVNLELQPAKSTVYIPATLSVAARAAATASAAIHHLVVKDGIIACGAAVGTDWFVQTFLAEKVQEAEDSLALLARYANNALDNGALQDAFLLLRNCIAPGKLIFLARTHPPHLSTPHFRQFDVSVTQTVLQMIEAPVNLPHDPARLAHIIRRIHLPTRYGGLGLSSLEEMAPASYIGSIGLSASIAKRLVEISPGVAALDPIVAFPHAHSIIAGGLGAAAGIASVADLYEGGQVFKLQQRLLLASGEAAYDMVRNTSPDDATKAQVVSHAVQREKACRCVELYATASQSSSTPCSAA